MMKTIKGSITISRPQGDSCDYINISISDRDSRSILTNVRVKYSDFAEALTGLSFQDCECDVYNVYERLGMYKISKTIQVPKAIFKDKYEKSKMRVILDKYLLDKNIFDDDWMLWDDGLSSRQDRENHEVVIYKYVDEKEGS